MKFTRADLAALLTGILFTALILYSAYLDARAEAPPPYTPPPYLDSGRL